MKEFLSRAGQTFVEKQVDEDMQAYADLIRLGFRTVPVTIVDGRAVKGCDEAALGAALAAS